MLPSDKRSSVVRSNGPRLRLKDSCASATARRRISVSRLSGCSSWRSTTGSGKLRRSRDDLANIFPSALKSRTENFVTPQHFVK